MLNNPEAAKSSFGSEAFLFRILSQDPGACYDVRRATEDQDKGRHYDLAWFDLGTGSYVFGDVKTVEPRNRRTGNYSIRKECVSYVENLPDQVLRSYFWIFELYREDGLPTGEYRMFPCRDILSEGNRGEIMTETPVNWLFNLRKAEGLIEGRTLKSDIPEV